jgi:hypothetical protein
VPASQEGCDAVGSKFIVISQPIGMESTVKTNFFQKFLCRTIFNLVHFLKKCERAHSVVQVHLVKIL